MKQVTKPVYQCDHCSKISTSAGAMAKHEARCRHNPAIRPLCWSCKHYNEVHAPMLTDIEIVEYFKCYDYCGCEHFGQAKMVVNKCNVDNSKLFVGFAIRNDELRTELEEHLWKPCPTINEGCKNYEARDNETLFQ